MAITYVKKTFRKKDRPRPRAYSSTVFDDICTLVAGGLSLSEICKRPGMPARATVYVWLQGDSRLRALYERANECRLEGMADSLMPTANDALKGCESVLASDRIQHAKLKITTTQWLLSRGHHGKYGDKAQSEPINGVVRVIVEGGWPDEPIPEKLSPEVQAACIAEQQLYNAEAALTLPATIEK
jgi:hypothetical protein